MTRIAAGTESMDVEDWMPSKIYLSVPLMWEILQFNSMTDAQEIPTGGLLDTSLTPPVSRDPGEGTTLEIIVATSPEITIDTADGGQQAPTISFKAPMTSASSAAHTTRNNNNSNSNNNNHQVCEDMSVDQTDSLTFNTTPWLYADSSQFVNIGDMGFQDQMTIGETRGMPWWEDENFGNIMFNYF